MWLAVSVVVAAAGDLAMIRMMADGHLPVEHRRGYRHVGDALSQIVKADGVVGCWKGCSPTVVRAMALNGAQLGGYSQAKEGILKLGLLQDGVACHFAASLFAGFIATVVSIPVDMVKTRCVCVCVIVWVCAWCFEARPSPAPPNSRSPPSRYQNMRVIDGKPQYSGVVDTLVKIVRSDGVLALWRGFMPYFLRLGPHSIVSLMTLEQVRRPHSLTW